MVYFFSAVCIKTNCIKTLQKSNRWQLISRLSPLYWYCGCITGNPLFRNHGTNYQTATVVSRVNQSFREDMSCVLYSTLRISTQNWLPDWWLWLACFVHASDIYLACVTGSHIIFLWSSLVKRLVCEASGSRFLNDKQLMDRFDFDINCSF